jgi:hypothetical protein
MFPLDCGTYTAFVISSVPCDPHTACTLTTNYGTLHKGESANCASVKAPHLNGISLKDCICGGMSRRERRNSYVIHRWDMGYSSRLIELE